MKKLKESLKEFFPDKNIILVIGISSDKKIPLMLEEIVRSASNRQRIKLLKTVKILGKAGKEKKEAFRYLEDILNEERRSPRRRQDHTREMPHGVK